MTRTLIRVTIHAGRGQTLPAGCYFEMNTRFENLYRSYHGNMILAHNVRVFMTMAACSWQINRVYS